MPDPGAYWCEKEELEAAGTNTTQLKNISRFTTNFNRAARNRPSS